MRKPDCGLQVKVAPSAHLPAPRRLRQGPSAPSAGSAYATPRANPIRILLVEDHRLVADALAALLNDQPDMQFVGNASSVAESGPSAAALKPDVIIVDFRLSDGTGDDAATAIWRAGCEAKLIFLTRDESDTVRLAAIEAGASAVLYKSMAAVELIDAVREVAGGRTLIGSGAIAALYHKRRESDRQEDKLTLREKQILRLMAQGVPSREIATWLGISYVTVRSHVRNLCTKLAAHSKLEVVVKAQHLHLID